MTARAGAGHKAGVAGFGGAASTVRTAAYQITDSARQNQPALPPPLTPLSPKCRPRQDFGAPVLDGVRGVSLGSEIVGPPFAAVWKS